MPEYKRIANIRGPVGPAPQLAVGDVDSVDSAIEAGVSVREISKDLHELDFKIPRGLPGVNAVNNDEATRELVNTEGTETRGALDSAYAPRAFFDNSPINIKDHGAVGDGVTDDSDAVRGAIIAALVRNPGAMDLNVSIHVPAGRYRITRNNIFSDFNFTELGLTPSVRAGIKFVGEGRHSSVFHLETGGEEKWFYNNGSINNQMFSRVDYEYLGFEADNPRLGNGWQQWSQGGEKQFRFLSCRINLSTIMQCEGTGNADLNRFLMCTITAYNYLFVLNNPQAVANETISSDLQMYRGMVKVLSAGGGSFRAIGGNFEMHQHPDDVSDHYLFDVPGTSSNGQGNGEFSVTDARFEIHGANKKLVRTSPSSNQLTFNFTRVQIGTVTGGVREAVVVTPTKRVHFENCVLSDQLTYRAEGVYASSSSTSSGARIKFLNSDTGRATPVHERCVADGNAAHISAQGCFQQSGSRAISIIRAQDFDFGWKNPLGGHGNTLTKIMPIKVGWLTYPTGAGANEPRIELPEGAYIKRVFIKKVSRNADSSPYRLRFGSDDKSVILGSSSQGVFGDQHVIELNDVGAQTFAAFRVWAEGTPSQNHGSGPDGVSYIEYI